LAVDLIVGRFGPLGSGDGSPIELVTVPRRVHVRVFDKLISLKTFGETFGRALKSIERVIV